MENKNEVSSIVKRNIVKINKQEVFLSKKNGYTVLGDIAIVLEKNGHMIDQCADEVAKYIAKNQNYKLEQRYKDEMTWFEKLVKNDPMKLEKLRAQQEFQNYVIVNGTKFAVSGLRYITNKALDYFDNRKMKEAVWKMSVIYADEITNKNYIKYPSVDAMLKHISVQLFGKIRDRALVTKEEWKKDFVLPNGTNYKNVAFVLYLIYSQKHLYQVDAESIPEDVLKLYLMWEIIGIFKMEAEELFELFKKIDLTVGYDFMKTNIVFSGIVNNLSISLPTSNERLVKKLNTECRKYIPYGDVQTTTRSIIKNFGEAVGHCGWKNINPYIVQAATTSALTLFDNTDDTQRIGNCLEDSGLDECMIKKCMEDAQYEKKRGYKESNGLIF